MVAYNIEKVPTVSVILQRDTGTKKPDGTPVMKRETPPVGKAFKFSKDEIESVMATDPEALRDPENESKSEEAKSEALKTAVLTGAAAADAANSAATGAVNKGKLKPGSTTEIDSKADEDTL